MAGRKRFSFNVEKHFGSAGEVVTHRGGEVGVLKMLSFGSLPAAKKSPWGLNCRMGWDGIGYN